MDYNEIGLITNITGAVLLFIFGSPFKLTKDFGVIMSSPTKRDKIIEFIVKSLSSLGMALVFIDFGFQFYYHNNSNHTFNNDTQLLPKANITLILTVLI